MANDETLSGFTKASELRESEHYLVNKETVTILAGPYDSVDELREDVDDDRAEDPALVSVTGAALDLLAIADDEKVSEMDP